MISANPPNVITVDEDAIQELTEGSHVRNKPSLCQGLQLSNFF